jgi:N-acetylglucosaminyldiphosphoundecaprenol N-acetyl-beta-D-mannosaminyltransferase
MSNLQQLPELPKYWLLGVWLNALDFQDLLGLIEVAIASRSRIVIANQNLHSVYICSKDAEVRRFFDEAAYTHADGTSLILVGRLKGMPLRSGHRIGYMDLFPALLPHIISNGWRIFYLGATDEVLQRGISLLKGKNPELQIAGHHGYFDRTPGGRENVEVIRIINEFNPNILFVGMGMPIQEHWILAHQNELDANVILHCGALMNYVAGSIPTPPRWLGPLGLEWIFRLATEPRRLWRRYLVEPIDLLITLRRKRKR